MMQELSTMAVKLRRLVIDLQPAVFFLVEKLVHKTHSLTNNFLIRYNLSLCHYENVRDTWYCG